MLLGGGAYLIALLMHDIGRAAEQLRDAQTREDQSRLQARDAQLQMLRTQISPHFLFNSLNSISALTSHNAAAARDMTLELAAFFRKTLALAEQERIALSQEIALCQHFLAVEKIRFGDKLRVAMDVSQAAGSVLIPPMLLQRCVENAIKHGVRHLPDGGCVTLRAFVQEPWLYVTIENPVDPDALAYADVEMVEGRGVGLANIRQRLSTVYGGQARIAWDLQQQRFSIEMVLPAQVPP
jgi:LytS/YehU family sensor histidine kinase